MIALPQLDIQIPERLFSINYLNPHFIAAVRIVFRSRALILIHFALLAMVRIQQWCPVCDTHFDPGRYSDRPLCAHVEQQMRQRAEKEEIEKKPKGTKFGGELLKPKKRSRPT